MNIDRTIEQLLASGKYPDPQLGVFGEVMFHEKKIRSEVFPRYGIISDNKDPLCLGRVRVACDTISPGTVTPWIPIIRLCASKNMGWWFLPEIGTQVILGCIGNNSGQAFIFGCIYDEKNLPPKHSTKDSAKSLLMQTKNHRMEIIDEDGKENITISTLKGKIRLAVSKEKGIQIINELGDINVSCRKLIIEGGKEIAFQAKKKIIIESSDALSLKSKKKTVMQNDKDVTMKGQCIKLQGSQGVTSEGKQLAAEGDKVMGFDIHNMQIPAGITTAVAPLPHPYMGKLVDGLAKDVKVNNHNAAIKGSKSKHDDPMHMQLPGTISFITPPTKEGEVTNGTGTKLKINGKEAAVIGSTVTTCNDMGLRDNSAIIAAGASMPMPIIINPKNKEEYEHDQEKQKTKNPDFTNVKWNKTNVKEGKEIELSAQVKDIDDGNMITFQVWRNGQDPNSDVPYWKIPVTIEGGTAKATWFYNLSNGAEIIPKQDPQFFFSAHSAWCPYKKSGNVTIKLKRPNLSNPVWKNKDGTDTNKGLVGEKIHLCVCCNDDFDEGAGVTFIVYNNKKEKIDEFSSTNKGGKAEAEWLAKDFRKKDDKTELTYTFSVFAKRIKEVMSDSITVKNPQIITMNWEPKVMYQGNKAKLLIASFEASDFSPTAKVQIWEDDNKKVQTFIHEQEIIIDKDEIEIEINTNFEKKLLQTYNEEEEYNIHAKIICENFLIKEYKSDNLTIVTGAIYD